MNTNKDLNYRLYLQRTSGFTRSPFNKEFERYKLIQSGDVEAVKKAIILSKTDYLDGKGMLSKNPVRNILYHFVVSAALMSRVCVEGGMSHDEAFTLSDIYIQRADECTSVKQILALQGEMQLDFANRMRQVRKTNIVSIHIRKCIDYIYDHLQDKLTVEILADYVGLNPSYLSRLFSNETGVSIKKFILNAKTETAENLLRYSDFSYLDISLALGFSTQSAFISVFRNQTGLTPKKYRDMYYSSNDIVPNE